MTATALPVILCFGRSGGTLVNQMLGTHPQCLVLSEVNPAASFKPVVEQAVEWLELLEPSQANAFELLSYAQQIRLLRQNASDRGKRLIVRDWSNVNFVAGCSPYACPSRTLEQVIYLSQAGEPINPLVVVRRSQDVYTSWRANFPQFADLDARVFSAAYLDYAAAVRHYPILRLEDLWSDPRSGIARLFAIFELEQEPLDFVLNHFDEFDRCTGNNTRGGAIASVMKRGVVPPSRAGAAALSVDSETAEQFSLADGWLGYE